MGNQDWALGKEYTVLLLDPDEGFRQRWQWMLERAKCRVVVIQSLEEIVNGSRKIDGNLLVTASVEINSDEKLKLLKELKEREDMQVLALAKPADEKLLMGMNIDFVPYPPVRDFLVYQVLKYREKSEMDFFAKKVVPDMHFMIRLMMEDLRKRNVEACMDKASYLCEKYPESKVVSDALFDVLHTTIEQRIDLPGLELHAVSTDAFYSAHGHPPLMRVWDGAFKRYLQRRRAICDLVCLEELERRRNETESPGSPDLDLLRKQQTVVNTARLRRSQPIERRSSKRRNAKARSNEIYVFMEYVHGPNLHNISAEVSDSAHNGDTFAQHFVRAVRYISNEWLAALQVNPIKLPGSVRRKKQEYYHSIREIFAECFPHVAKQMGAYDHLALRRSIRWFLGALNNYSPVQYFDMCAKNLMLKIDGKYDSTFDDVRAHFKRSTGREPFAASFDDVFNYLSDSVLRKVDWNKTYRVVHPGDDARHESPHLPISISESPVLDLHAILIREKERLISQQIKKVKSSSTHASSQPGFQKIYARIERLDNLAYKLASKEVDLQGGLEEAKGLLPQRVLSGFAEMSKETFAAWMYRAMRTFKLTKLEYLPEERRLRDNARNQMTDCYVNSEVKAELEQGKKELELEERIATIVKRVDSPERRPFFESDIFVAEPIGDASKYIKPRMLATYVRAANAYLRSYANARALHSEMVFCLDRMKEIFDFVIAQGVKGKAKELQILQGSVNDSERYYRAMRSMEKEYGGHLRNRLGQYTGALYLRAFLDKFIGKVHQREYGDFAAREAAQ